MRLWVALPALALALCATTARAQDQEEQLRYPPSSVRAKLIAGGIVVGGLAYAGGYLAQSQWPEVPGSTALTYPVIGPWISLAKIGCAATDSIGYSGDPIHVGVVQVTGTGCGAGTLFLRGFLTVLDGLAQLGGLGMIGEGLFMTTEADTPDPKKAPSLGLTIRPTPVFTGTTTGFGFAGVF